MRSPLLGTFLLMTPVCVSLRTDAPTEVSYQRRPSDTKATVSTEMVSDGSLAEDEGWRATLSNYDDPARTDGLAYCGGEILESAFCDTSADEATDSFPFVLTRFSVNWSSSGSCIVQANIDPAPIFSTTDILGSDDPDTDQADLVRELCGMGPT